MAYFLIKKFLVTHFSKNSKSILISCGARLAPFDIAELREIMSDDVYGGRLPVYVRRLLDEFANIGQIPNFDKLIATIRSREISASIHWRR